jgi:amino acid adenylation domain-containing protein/non-ribosomal peptide synthase protein (TIGR01720 family)/FkbM family methyltransferase
MYTSGTTGLPKGIAISHQNIVSLVHDSDSVTFRASDRVLQWSNYAFDGSTFEIYNTLLKGAALYLISEETASDVYGLSQAIMEHRITVCFLTTALFNAFVDNVPEGLAGLRRVLFGGEKGSPAHVRKAFSVLGPGKMVNLYGPTEITVYASSYVVNEIGDEDVLPIGRPAFNTQVLILDEGQRLVATGIGGELYIGGDGVASGYVNNPELDAERFVYLEGFNGKWYRTGDYGRWRADGNIEYIGRKDEQVKIRGYRIELGEIENVLQEAGGIRQSVVIAKEDASGGKRLIAYVVAEDFDREAITVHLKKRLPEYMVPSAIMQIESVPLNSNGKVDRKALPDADLSAVVQHRYEAPQNELQRQLQKIWQDLLEVEQVGIHDNFFELGGDSIITIQVVSRARKAGYDIVPRDLFLNQTIARLSAAAGSNAMVSVNNAEQGALAGDSPLLPVQQWYFDNAPSDVHHFNQSVLLAIDKSVTHEQLQQVITHLTDHHDALRFIYQHNNNNSWSQTYGTYKPQLFSEDVSGHSDMAALIAQKSNQHQRSLSLEKGELVRAVLFNIPASEADNRLLLVIHHLAVDGVSWRILLQDMEELLSLVQKGQMLSLGAKGCSYREWSNALQQYGATAKLQAQKTYWQDIVQQFAPFEKEQITESTPRMGRFVAQLSTARTRQLLQGVSKAYRSEINDILLSALGATLCAWSGRRKVVVGLEGHGREEIVKDIDTSRTVGWFTSMYPVLLEAAEDSSALVRTTKEHLRQVPQKGIGYGVLKYICKEENLQGQQPWEVVFNYLGQLDNVVGKNQWLKGATESSGGNMPEEYVPGGISVNALVQEGELVMNWSYSSAEYSEASMAALGEAYIGHLETLIEHCLSMAATPVSTPSDHGLAGVMGWRELDSFLDAQLKAHPKLGGVEAISRLSGAQEGMLFHALYDDHSSAYTHQFSCELTQVDEAVFVEGWKYILKNHAILRTAFHYDVFNIPVQCVYRHAELPVTITDLRGLTEDQQLESIAAYRDLDGKKGFNLQEAPLMRLSLLRLDEQRYYMLWTFHHIIFDGWSMPVVVEEFLRIYDSLLSGEEVEAGATEDRYEDYIRYVESRDKEQEEHYWKGYMKGLDEGSQLPFVTGGMDRNRGGGSYNEMELLLNSEQAGRIQECAREYHVTVNTLMQGVWSYLLHQYMGREHVVYGVTVSGRPADMKDVEHRVGMYINTLPVHGVLKQGQSIAEWLEQLQAAQLQGREYQYTSLAQIQEWTGMGGDMFDTLYAFQNYPVSKIAAARRGNLEIKKIQFHTQTNYPLTLMVVDGEEIRIVFQYNTSLLKTEYMEQIRRQFRHVVLQIIESATDKLDQIEILTPEEKHQLVHSFNDTYVDYPSGKNVVELFEEQVRKTPDSLALIFKEEELTYGQLNERSNQLARYLQSRGVASQSFVPVLMERSVEMIVSILAILKTGAAYVPVDPQYPQDRIAYILEDTKAKLVLTTSLHSEALDTECSILCVDEVEDMLSILSPHDLNTSINADDLCYVIYTSGSTGRPKGVMNHHGGLLNYLHHAKDHYMDEGRVEGSGSFMHLSFTFDASLTALFVPLLSGRKLVVGSANGVEVFGDAALVKHAPYDFIKLTPAHLGLLHEVLERCPSLTRRLVVGGEALQRSHVQPFFAQGTNVEIINEYGPTEATVGCSTYSFNTQDADNVEWTSGGASIGKPIGNTRIRIVDAALQLCGVGVPGELCVSGVQVAKGYLNLEELTAEKFVKDPFNTEASARMYRTGDIARWTAEGNIEYIGRKDEQVKIRGYRIEPGEIEQQLCLLPGVKEAKVVSRTMGTGEDKKLAAYVVPDKEQFALLSTCQHMLDRKRVNRSELHTMPNGMPVFNSNLNEVRFLYKEIFEDICYLQHGLSLNSNSTVIDIGANAGFFTVFLNMLHPGIDVYSFEPIPEVHNYLCANRELYGINGKAFQVAITDREGEIDFNYYPLVTIVSGISEDREKVREAVRSYIQATDKAHNTVSDIDSVLDVRLESKKIKCKTKSVSQVIAEEGIERIDLLKIDVENSEHLVIGGIEESDWSKIGCIIIEVHNVDDRVSRISALLSEKGFFTYVEKEQSLANDEILYNLFAFREAGGGVLRALDGEEQRMAAQWMDPSAFTKEVKESLEKKLPSYMVPSHVISIGSFPLTSNGKVDVKALPQAEPAAGQVNGQDFQAPEGDVEQALAAIWEELLGMEKIGAHDDFFQLGGDSIITIQVVSRARREGYELHVADLFDYHTITQLASVIRQRSGSQSSSTGTWEPVTGESGLLPVQQWYLGGDPASLPHFNQAVLLNIDKNITGETLENAIRQLVTHHDALRFTYEKTGSGWKQRYGTQEGSLDVISLSPAEGQTLADAIEQQCNNLQGGMDLQQGKLLRAVLMLTPGGEPSNRLFLAVHHLAVDAVSWRILLEDLECLLPGKSATGSLLSKTTSYSAWFDALAAYGTSRRLVSQLPYWVKNTAAYRPLPYDTAHADDVTAADMHEHNVKLDRAWTKKLLQETSKAYNTEINDLLLGALAKTLASWTNSSQVTIGLEGHGRENISEGADTSRTVGWFTTLYPLMLEIEEDMPEAAMVKSVKEQLRLVPDKGIGYGVLKYMNRENSLEGRHPWDIVFNYLGQLDNVAGSSQSFSVAQESAGETISPAHKWDHKIALNSMVQGGELILGWSYSNKHFTRETIAMLSGMYVSALEALVEHCITQRQVNYTPSDFGTSSFMSFAELDAFLDETFRGHPRRLQADRLYPLSALQEGMLFHALYDDRVMAYTNRFTCELINPDLDAFTQSWDHLLKSHSILRTAFYHDAFSKPVQCVYKEAAMPVTILDFRHMTAEEQGRQIERFEEEDQEKGFDLREAPLMRITLFRLADDRYFMLWLFHHIILDGWSMPVLMQEVLQNYDALVAGKAFAARPQDRYEDFIRYIQNKDKEQEEEHWRGYMKGAGPDSLLPFISSTSLRNQGIGSYKTKVLQLDNGITAAIAGYAQRQQVTVNTLMQGVWAWLLYCYTGQPEITYGITVSGRPAELQDVESRVGLYINALPFHSTVEEGEKIAEWLRGIQQRQVSSSKYQHTSLKEIQKWSGVHGDLFDSLLVFENYPVAKMLASANWQLNVSNVKVSEHTNYPLNVLILSEEQTHIHFEYNTGLMDEAYISMMLRHFRHVLLQIVEDNVTLLRDLGLMDDEERKQLVHRFNDTAVDYPSRTVVELFEEQVQKTPETTAVVFEGEELTYAELNKRSNQLARHLQQQGVGSQSLVPLLVERSAEMIVSILAVLKAGAAYVPIDPEYPLDRIAYMLEDTHASVVITSAGHTHLLEGIEDIAIICPGLIKDSLAKNDRENLNASIKADDLCYVIYTSGSTGRPKGVMNEHRGIVNRLLFGKQYFNIGTQDAVLQKTTYCFDVSVWELLWPLLSGARLVFAHPQGHKDPAYLRQVIREQGITVVHFVPSMLEVFLEGMEPGECRSLKHVLCSGEALRPPQVAQFRSKMGHVALHNLYGPTEAAIEVSCWTVPEGDVEKVLIGKPVANTQLYILDHSGAPVPIGVKGELYIGGVQVARGYLNLDELTREKFIADPFSADASARLYRTGDIARWTAGGEVEYLGRKDDQVKIRGYRIELGEIESVLQQAEGINQCVVIVKEDASGGKRLIAYVVAERFDREAITAHLEERLPEYMVPSVIISIESIPLNSNGKADRKALPEVGLSASVRHHYEAPQNELQQQLQGIWQDLLEVETVGIHDNFFELGGHSLLAMRLVSALRKKIGREVPIREVFVHPTILALSEALNTGDHATMLPQIQAYERTGLVPLSFAQERLWFIDRLQGSVQYHMPWVFRLTGPLNLEALEDSFRAIMRRHEVLRTVIGEEDGIGCQQVLDATRFRIGIRQIEDIEAHTSLEQYIEDEAGLPFDLGRDMMLRVSLVRLTDEEHLLVAVVHHIAFDGWSIGIMVEELTELYASRVEQREVALKELPVQYADYAIWQRQYLSGELLEQKLSYWKNQLGGVLPLELMAGKSRPLVQSAKGGVLAKTLPLPLGDALVSLSGKEGVTLFMTLLTAFKVLLHKYSGQEDICVGTPAAGRQQQEVEDLIGFFINTLALRTQVSDDLRFTDLLQQVKQTTLDAYQHQDVPFEKIVEALGVSRDMSRTPVFQVLFNFQKALQSGLSYAGNLHFHPQELPSLPAKFEITLDVQQTDEGLMLQLIYAADLYPEAAVAAMLRHYEGVLMEIVQNVSATIGNINILTREERHQLVHEFNDTAVEYSSGKSIVDLFEEQVLKTPELTAVVLEGEELTYAELNKRSNQLARHLQQQGAGSRSLVPLLVERSAEMIVSILAVLKAGAAYVPIDPEYPQDRIAYMLEDTHASVVITSAGHTHLLEGHEGLAIVCPGLIKDSLAKNDIENLNTSIREDDLCYVIYTSGSTGRPKGVMNEHRGIVNRLLWMQQHFGLTSSDAVLQKTTYCFDVSVWELLWPLLSGARLVFARPQGHKDPAYLRQVIREQDITVVHFVPSMLEVFLEEMEPGECIGLKHVLCSGEALRPPQVAQFRSKMGHVALHNLYGPTEAAIDVSCWTVPEGEVEKVLIGKPVANTQLYILDHSGAPVPVGVKGELYIGGVQVARGYLNLDELTRERFIADPFSADASARLYRTGDIARWTADGNIEYLGRKDDQVKIRGYRIELGEIESVLQQAEGISQCVVIVKEDASGGKRLIAYVVAERFDREAITAHLKARLPEYMVPSLVVEIDSMPLTSNGKADRKALPEVGLSASVRHHYESSQNELQQQLQEIWQNLLRVEQIGIHDNFFELGGHSLLAMRLVSALRKKIGREVPIREVFVNPTILALSEAISGASQTSMLPPIQVYEKSGLVPLSFAQERLWFIDRLQGSVQYHMPWVFRLSGPLNLEALEDSFRAIIHRHEVLRTVIGEEDGIGYQQVRPADGWKLQNFNAVDLMVIGTSVEQFILEEIEQPYNLRNDSILKVTLIRLSEQEYLMLAVIHHIAFDGWSIGIMVEELTELYASRVEQREVALKELPVQYADYSIWQRQYLSGELLEQKLSYWTNKLSGVLPLEIRPDKVRPLQQSSKGAIARRMFVRQVQQSLVSLSNASGTTLFMTLLAAFKVLLHKYSGQQDICVGTPTAGRQQQEVEGLIGFFINTLALRTEVSDDLRFTDLLQQVKQTTLDAYQHQEVPFEKIVEALGVERDMSRTPVFQVLFSLQNAPEAEALSLGDVRLKEESFGQVASQFDLNINLQPSEEGLQIVLVYCSDLYHPATIERLLDHYHLLLQDIVEHTNAAVGSLGMLSHEEKHQLVHSFNATDVAYPSGKNVVELFEEQVRKTPDSLALIFKDEELTYGQLNERSNQLARYLQSKGVAAQAFVPVLMERSAEMIVSILAILKTGAAYVPVDPQYPQDRIAYILEDTRAKLVLTTSLHSEALDAAECSILCVDEVEAMLSILSPHDLHTPINADDLCYVIYTSGSTGRPKGVMNHHGGLLNYLHHSKAHYMDAGRVEGSGSFMHLSFTFDASLTALFVPLLSGRKLVVGSANGVEVFGDAALVKHAPYDFIKLTPAHLGLLHEVLERCPSLTRRLVVGGEALQRSHVQPFFAQGTNVEIINEYGPTEATVGCSTYSFNTQDADNAEWTSAGASIGKPIGNTRIYIMDASLQLCGVGVPGELCVSGVQVAKGYLNLEELTAEKFVKDPFNTEASARMYRTGDIARWTAEGNIEYIGRKDEQVKIRGYRIELGEIESVLQQAEGVRQSVVIAKEDASGGKRLIAYVVAENFDREAITAHLKERLPEYMVPSAIMEIESIPLTSNGKVDRKALPDADLSASLNSGYEAPRTAIEEQLASIWQELLEVERVSIHDNFFELGGHSLLGIRVVSYIKQQMSLSIPIQLLFEFPTIASLSDYIELNIQPEEDHSVAFDVVNI